MNFSLELWSLESSLFSNELRLKYNQLALRKNLFDSVSQAAHLLMICMLYLCDNMTKHPIVSVVKNGISRDLIHDQEIKASNLICSEN